MEFETSWKETVLRGLGMITLMGLISAACIYCWNHAKPQKAEPLIKWIEQPFSIEKDAKGQPISTIVIGLDDKGFVRWGRGAPPPTPPIAAPAKQKP